MNPGLYGESPCASLNHSSSPPLARVDFVPFYTMSEAWGILYNLRYILILNDSPRGMTKRQYLMTWELEWAGHSEQFWQKHVGTSMS